MPSFFWVAALLAIGLMSAGVVQSAEIIVTVANGTIHGVRCNGSNATAFLGIPYAAAPARFAGPRIYNAKYNSSGLLYATAPAPSCPQFGAVELQETSTQTEDCLFIDVFVPANTTTTSRLPVKVWVTGQSNENGGISDPASTGCFAATDSIQVSVGYRLGPLGFLLLPRLNVTGNNGLLDQLTALQWIQANVGAFGGDPRRVLLVGQSAGAVDVFVLSSLPQAPQLFAAAAMQSGGGRRLPTTAEVVEWNENYAAALACHSDNATADLACLLHTSIAALKAAAAAAAPANVSPLASLALTVSSPWPLSPSAQSPFPSTPPSANTPLENVGKGAAWGPVVDGAVVAAQPVDRGVQVPSIVGSNANEGALCVLSHYGAGVFSLKPADYYAFLEHNFGPLAGQVNQTFPLLSFADGVPPDHHAELPATAFTAMVSIITDVGYACPSYRALASGAARGVATYAYRFNHTPSCRWHRGMPTSAALLALLGATHSAEIPFVLDLIRQPLPAGPDSFCTATADERTISAAMLNAWTAMAAAGKPGSVASVEWPTFTLNGTKGLVVDARKATIAAIDYSRCGFWNSLDASMASLAASAAASVSAIGSGSQTSPATPIGSSGSASPPGQSKSSAFGMHAELRLVTAIVVSTLCAVIQAMQSI